MSKLRPECTTGKPCIYSRNSLLWMIRNAVSKKRSLGYGKLHDEDGRGCAMGPFWDTYNTSVPSDLVDEVAAVNDSVPPTATPKERWQTVMRWLRWQTERI